MYRIVLQKDTFFTANRHFLISGIITSLLLPFLIFTKTVYVNAPVNSTFQNYTNLISDNSSDVIQQVSFNWGMLLMVIYFIGIILMSFRFIFQLFSLYTIIQKYTAIKKNGFHYIKAAEDISPFSFFKYIVYNPENHSEEELEMILKHEQTHASQFHSVDIILSNLLLIVQWMNPFAWFYKKSIEENLEFIADNETIQRIPSKTQYQLTLLKAVSSTATQPILANNFYQSLIKKRIIMLHKNQSSSKNQWKLLLILPLLGVFLWSFNVEEKIKYHVYPASEVIKTISSEIPSVEKTEKIVPVISEEKTTVKNTKSEVVLVPIDKKPIQLDSKITVTIDKNTTDAELEKLKKLFKNSYNVSLKFSGVKRNSQGELTAIKVKMKSENSNSNYNINDEKGINEFSISYDSENDAMNIGNRNRYQIHVSPDAASAYVYEINENNNGNISTWVSSDANVVRGSSKHVIHTNGGDGEQEIHIISGDGQKSTVWVSKDGKTSKSNMHTIIKESDEESNGDGGEENIFVIKSGDEDSNALFIESSNNDDSIFVKVDENGENTFIIGSGEEDKNALIIESNNDDDSIFVKSDGKSGVFISDSDNSSMSVYINGKKSTVAEMEKLGNKIASIEVLKGDDAVKKYGKEAKDGVILITTKSN